MELEGDGDSGATFGVKTDQFTRCSFLILGWLLDTGSRPSVIVFSNFFAFFFVNQLLGPLFLIMPFPMLHQMFVLHTPNFDCIHPEDTSHESLGINFTQWQVTKLK